MSTDVPDEVPEEFRRLGDEFFVFEVVPPGNEDRDRRFTPFSLFLVSVSSESEEGNAWNSDPLGLIRRLDPRDDVFRIPRDDDVHVMTFRVNAELPVNPKYTKSIVQVTGGSTRVLIVHFKVHAPDPSA